MFAPGSGGSPYVGSISSTCDAATGESIITASARSNISGVTVYVTLNDSSGNIVWEGSSTLGVATYFFEIRGTANGSYTLVADNGEGPLTERQVTVFCTAVQPTTCTIDFATYAPVAPTSAAGFGAITYTLQGLQGQEAQVRLYTGGGSTSGGSYGTFNLQQPGNLSGVFGGLQPGLYVIWAQETGGGGPQCNTQEVEVIVPAYQPPVGPVLPPPPPTYYAVGGVLPNPVQLPCEVASLTTLAGLPRVGLHVEVELRRAGVGGATFATAKKTVRKLQELVEVAAYLRPELRTLQAYAPNSGLVRDPNTAFAFAYRYREVDSSGPGVWVDKPNPNYAVLAARPATNVSLQDLVAEVGSYCGWASVFPSGEAVQFVGYPLEVGILIPDRAADLPTFLEAVYYDAGGGVLEIRTWPVLASAPAGYYRICLPQDPLPCAAKFFLAVCNEDRAFTGTCAGLVIPPVVTPTGRIIVGQGYLIRK